MIAIRRLQSIFWILLVAFGALSAYLISLRVSTERNAVRQLERKIAQMRADIRYLETEFEARASMRQLEKWNARDYRFVTATAGQYLPDERALAALDRVPSNGETFVAPPVMMAMAEPDAATPSAPAPVKAAADPKPVSAPAAIVRAALAAPAAPVPQVKVALARAETPARPAAVKTAQPARVALLDAKLLDERTLKDLGLAAAAEKQGRAAR